MQASIGLCCSSLQLFHRSTSNNAVPERVLPVSHRTAVINRRISAAATSELSTVDYSSSISVFPAEACDTVGGEACNSEMFPETKPPTPTTAVNKVETEEIERDYLEYNEPKTVFPGEACDELGGEFCEPEYQQGIYKEKALS